MPTATRHLFNSSDLNTTYSIEVCWSVVDGEVTQEHFFLAADSGDTMIDLREIASIPDSLADSYALLTRFGDTDCGRWELEAEPKEEWA